MEGRQYQHLQLIDFEKKLYQPFSGSSIEVNTLKLSDENRALDLLPQFSSILIPSIIDSLIDDFLNQYSIKSEELNKSKLATLISGAQHLFISNQEVVTDELTKGFFDEIKERRKIIDLLEQFQFQDRRFIQEVNFKNSDGNKKIKNFFVAADIYRALIQYWNLDVENQEDFRKQKGFLLEELNQVNYKKLDTYCKYTSVQSFYNAINFLNVTQNEKLKIIGVFILCAQIPIGTNNTGKLSPVFKENFSEIPDYQHIRLILERDKTFLIK